MDEKEGESLYDILGVSPTATEREIRSSYRNLVLRTHPDRAPGEASATEQFRRIVDAYAVLGSADRRARYDQELAARRTSMEDALTALRQQTAAPATLRRKKRDEPVFVDLGAPLDMTPFWRRTRTEAALGFLLGPVGFVVFRLLLDERAGELPLLWAFLAAVTAGPGAAVGSAMGGAFYGVAQSASGRFVAVVVGAASGALAAGVFAAVVLGFLSPLAFVRDVFDPMFHCALGAVLAATLVGAGFTPRRGAPVED